jgi:hypothetical protein
VLNEIRNINRQTDIPKNVFIFTPNFTLHISAVGLTLWFSGHSSWLQIQRSRFDSRRYQIFWEVAGLERGPLSLVSTTEELLGRKKISGSGLENREYDRRDPSRWPRDILYPQKLALISPTCGGWSVGIVRWRTKATEFSFFCILNSRFPDFLSGEQPRLTDRPAAVLT